MNLKQLECFNALAKTLNFTKAAEQVYVSQSAFSRLISSLEEELGCTLIIRSKTNPQLTQAGMRISAITVNILNDVARIESIAMHSQKSMEGKYLAGTLAGGLMPEERDFLRSFYRAHENVTFDIKEFEEGALLTALDQEKIDFAFFSGLWNEQLEKYDSYRLGRKRLMFVCAPNHPLAGRESVDIEELKNERLGIINPEKNFFFVDQIKRVCMEKGFLPQMQIVADSIFSLVDYIEVDLASSIMLENIFNLSIKGVAGIPINDIPLCEQLLLIRREDERPVINAMRSYAITCEDKLGGDGPERTARNNRKSHAKVK